MARASTPDHLPTLDGLRGVAVALVLWAHLPRDIAGPWVARLEYLVRPGYLGVDVFFVLSGLLITRILLAERMRGRAEGEGALAAPTRFWIRRFLRIFPIYYLGLVALSFVYDGPDLGWSAVYLQNFWYASHAELASPLKHTWSLAVEEHFYLVWPFVVLWLPPNASRAVVQWVLLPASIVGAVITIVVADPDLATELVYRGTPYRMGSLALGAIFAYHEGWLRAHPRKTLRLVLLLATAAFVIVPLGRFGLAAWHPLSKMIGFSALSGAIVLAGLLAHGRPSLVHRALVHPWARALGRISYGVYLFHFPIYVALGLRFHAADAPPSGLVAIVGIVATLVVAWASFHAIERPLLRIKDRVGRPRPAGP